MTKGEVLSLTRVEGLGQGSERRVSDISVGGRTPQSSLRGFSRGLTADGQGLIIRVDGKEGWAQPYQVVIWEIPDKTKRNKKCHRLLLIM